VERAEVDEQVRALREGRAFVARDDLRMTWVSGSEAAGWLHDLVTAAVEDLEPFETRRSLLLSPTGRIRADFHVLGFGDRRSSFLLAQPADQPEDLSDVLARYVLSSDVDLRPAPFHLLSVPNREETPAWAEGVWRPSVLGGGYDVVATEGGRSDAARRRLSEDGLVEASPLAVDAWRIRAGQPRFPVDLDAESFPAEAGLDDEVVIDRTKGCFLGQESVAKIRNLGHPTRVLRALRAAAPVARGEVVLADTEEVGTVTSVDEADGTSALIARIRWDARRASLTTAAGTRLLELP
jgi:hypothetical protein